MSSYYEFFGGAVPLFSAGPWSQDSYALCPANKMVYIKTGASGTSSTNPSADPSNWALVGAPKRKSFQEGWVTIAANAATGTATVSAVVIANHRLAILGVKLVNTYGVDMNHLAVDLRLTATNQLTAERVNAGVGSEITVRFQLEELWPA